MGHKMPSQVEPGLSVFDRFATVVSGFAARATFFVACVLMVLIWAPSYFLLGDIEVWQLIINTLTTIVTFLMVALLQNTQSRADAAIQHKLNAIAKGLADVMDAMDATHPELDKDHEELEAAVGLEERESA